LPKAVNVISESDFEAVNLNTILYKLQLGRYLGWDEAVQDLKKMVASVKEYLKVSAIFLDSHYFPEFSKIFNIFRSS
jgi:hypothetical protein